MTILTWNMLKRIGPNIPSSTVTQRAQELQAAMDEFHIDTSIVQAMFLAQIMHESGELRYTQEIASGAAYDTGQLALRLGNTPEADGDGEEYKGRGYIQITGRTNYAAISLALNIDAMNHPEMLAEPVMAARSAAWYWSSNNLNQKAGTGTLDNFKAVTKAINGGYNGLDDRLKYWTRTKKEYGITG